MRASFRVTFESHREDSPSDSEVLAVLRREFGKDGSVRVAVVERKPRLRAVVVPAGNARRENR